MASEVQEPAYKKKVFIGCAKEDYSAAIRLSSDLKTPGLDPWINKKDLLPYQLWTDVQMLELCEE